MWLCLWVDSTPFGADSSQMTWPRPSDGAFSCVRGKSRARTAAKSITVAIGRESNSGNSKEAAPWPRSRARHWPAPSSRRLAHGSMADSGVLSPALRSRCWRNACLSEPRARGTPMAEKSFRYVRCERAAAWEAAAWQVISGPLDVSPPPGLEGRATPCL